MASFNDVLLGMSEGEEETNETPLSEGEGQDSGAQTDEWTVDTRYAWYNDYGDENLSIIDNNKNITLNNAQAIVTKESYSQFLPFRMPRYFDQFDLTTGFIQIHWVNSAGYSSRATAVNVSYNSEYIKFGWLLGPDVTDISGVISFEIDIIGTNSQGQSYRYITRSNSNINILGSLGEHDEIEIDQSWVSELINQVSEKLADAQSIVDAAQAHANDARDSAALAANYAQDVDSTIDAAEQTLETYVDDNMGSLITSSLANYYDKDVIDSKFAGIDGLADFGVLYDDSTNNMLFYNKGEEVESGGVTVTVDVEGTPTQKQYKKIGEAAISTLDDLDITYDQQTGKLALINKGVVTSAEGVTPVTYEEIGSVTIYSEPTSEWTQGLRSAITTEITNAVAAATGDITSYKETVTVVDEETGESSEQEIDRYRNLVAYEKQTDADLASIHSAIDDLPSTLASDYYTKAATDNLLAAKASASALTALDNTVSGIESRVSALDDNQTGSVKALANKVETAEGNIQALQTAVAASTNTTYDASYDSETGRFVIYEDPVYTDQERDVIDTENSTVRRTFVIQGGGGGGTTESSTVTLRRVSPATIVSLVNNGTIDQTLVQFTYTSVDSNEEPVPGAASCVWKIDKKQVATSTCEAGTNSFDITAYLKEGSQTLSLQVTDPVGTIKTLTWVIKVVNVRIESTFNDKITYTAGRDITLGFIPYGQDVEKTIKFELRNKDNVLVSSGTYTDSNSGYTRSFTITGRAHGSYYLDLWMEATVNDNVLNIPHIYKDILFRDASSSVPLIGVSQHTYTATEYDTVSIDYFVVDPATDTPTVELRVYDSNDTLVSTETQNLSSNMGVWNYKATTVGTFKLQIACGATTRDLSLAVAKLDIDITQVTDGLVYDFNPAGKSNSSTDTTATNIWTSDENAIHLTVSNNFDWINGGYHADSNGDTYFCVKAGTRAYIDHQMFAPETDIRVTGMEYKVIYKVTNVSDYQTTVISCIDGTNSVGLQVNPHEAYVNSSSSSLYVPLSEEDIIEFEFNIAANSEAVPMVMSYEDGVPCMPLVYSNADVFNQTTGKVVTIGSDSCDVHIYRMRAYDKSLTNKNILDNFIADGRNAAEIVDRYSRNNIYNSNGDLTPESVYNACPELRVIVISSDHFTTGKKDTRSGATIRCMYKGTAADDPETIRQNNWTAINAGVSGQGTSSEAYGASARNVDLRLNIKESATYTSTVTVYTYDGETYTEVPIGTQLDKKTTYWTQDSENSTYTTAALSDISTKTVTSPATTITLDDGDEVVKKVALSATSIPNNYFNVKLNVASSENANNALLQKRYDRFLPYQSVAKQNDSRVKNSMEFFNCVIFIQETDENLNNHVEFNDNNIHFYGIGNMGDSKKTDSSRADDPDDPNEFCVELMDVDRPLSEFPTGATALAVVAADPFDEKSKFTIDGVEYTSSYGIRYGDDEDPATVAYIKSTWLDFYTFLTRNIDDNDPEDVAAWKAEFQTWFILQDAMYYYLFTLYNTMIDNRAKNTFWHYSKSSDGQYRFSFWDYDNDSSLGINNTGKLTMTYGTEDFDKDDQGNYHFRCANSTFFVRLAKYFESEIAALYNDIQAACWSATDAINEFDAWQAQFPEELWRLDFERKYLRPYTGTVRDPNANPVTYFFEPATNYLQNMANGKKKYQRRQFLRNQEIYMASKFVSAAAVNSKIQLRCSNPSDYVVVPNYTITVTPYMNMYLNIYNGQVQVMHQRAEAGHQYSVQVSDSNGADFIYIYSASRIQSLGDLSAMYLNYCDIGSAEKLKEFVIGNTTAGYQNIALTTLTFGSNTLLSEIDMRNATNLTSAFDFGNLSQLQVLHAEGSGISGVSFANGGMLREAYLPASITTISAKNLSYLETFELAGLSNLAYLTVENCPVINTLYMLQNAPNLSRIRLTGIDWNSSYNLQNTDIFDYAMGLNGFDSSGAITSKSVLAGAAYVAVIKEQKFYDYTAFWPQLSFTYGSMTQTVIATFVNEDETVLDVQYVDYGTAAVDPTTRADNPIAIPTKASTIDKNYTFSGWNTGASGFVALFANITYTAQYTASTRKYTIEYAVMNNVIQTTEADYGTTVFYTGATPTYTAQETAYTYYLFDGWDKSGYVSGNKRINAVFDSCSYTDAYFQGKDLADMRPVEIYALTQASRQTSTINVSDYIEEKDAITFTMGNDYEYSDIEQVEIVSEKSTALYRGRQVLDGASVLNTGLNPFAEDQDWVLAIDYKFAEDCPVSSYLLHCRYGSQFSQGLRMYCSGGGAPMVGYNNSNQPLNSLGSRDIIVIRHTKGSDSLMVYKGDLPASSISTAEMSSGLYNVSDSASIVFGAESTSEGYFNYSKGTIYWAKLWYADLGDAACRNLAAWTHEKITMEVSGFRKYYIVDDPQNRRAALTFMAANVLENEMRLSSSSSNSGGWAQSQLNNFLNERFYNALPLQWRGLIKQVYVTSTIGAQSSELTSSNCYIYIPAAIEVSSGFNYEPYASEGTVTNWLTSDNTRIRSHRDEEAATTWHTRSPNVSSDAYVWYVTETGHPETYTYGYTYRGVVIMFSV